MCLGKSSIAQEERLDALYSVADEAPFTTRDSGEVERVLSRRCYARNRNLLVLEQFLGLSVDAVRSAPRGAHYVIFVPLCLGLN